MDRLTPPSGALNRLVLPDRIDGRALDLLDRAMDAADRADQPLLLQGACAGMDVGAVAAAPGGMRTALQRFADTLMRLHELPVATLALVEGPVLGGGLGLVAACDLVLAAPAASFGLPELLIGVVPGMVWPVLAERVAPARLRRLALEGAAVSAEQAVRIGLADELSTAVGPWARRLSRGDRAARTLLKRSALRPAVLTGLEQTLSLLQEHPALSSPDTGGISWSS